MKIIFNFWHLPSKKYPLVYGISESDLPPIDHSALESTADPIRTNSSEHARLDTKLAEIRERHPFLSEERCAAILEYEESITDGNSLPN
jgi:hypothetical protein